MTSRQVRVIGLTGGIASGKSTVAAFFRVRGVPVIDADELSREAVAPGSVILARIAGLFGDEVLMADGSLDRARVRKQVFSDPEKRRLLENIIHPEIRRLAEAKIQAVSDAGHHLAIYMAPLLLETGGRDRVDELWVVTVRPETQLQRLMLRDTITEEQARQIISSQMPLAEKARCADLCIDNDGGVTETEEQLEKIWRTMVATKHE